MDNSEWVKEFTGDSLRGVARKLGLGASNLQRQLKAYLPADRVIEIANAYGKDPVRALKETGHIKDVQPLTPSELIEQAQELLTQAHRQLETPAFDIQDFNVRRSDYDLVADNSPTERGGNDTDESA